MLLAIYYVLSSCAAIENKMKRKHICSKRRRFTKIANKTKISILLDTVYATIYIFAISHELNHNE